MSDRSDITASSDPAPILESFAGSCWIEMPTDGPPRRDGWFSQLLPQGQVLPVPDVGVTAHASKRIFTDCAVVVPAIGKVGREQSRGRELPYVGIGPSPSIMRVPEENLLGERSKRTLSDG